MSFESFLNSFQTGDSSWQESPVLLERIQYVKDIIINNKPAYTRSLKAPEFLTDFGLRKSDSQFIFIEQSCQQLGIALPTEKEIEDELNLLEISRLATWVDSIVLLLGYYEVCHTVIKQREKELDQIHSVLDLIKLATLCGIVSDVTLSTQLFKRALALSQNQETKRLILHRLCVLELKRANDIDKFYHYLGSLTSNIVTQNDSEESLVLIDNLLALFLVTKKDCHLQHLQEARLLLLSASKILESSINKFGPSDSTLLSELVRYHSQVAINQVQLELEIGNFDQAKHIIDNSISLSTRCGSEYIAEELATSAYINFRSASFDSAITDSISALTNYSSLGNTQGVKRMKQILAASLAKLGLKDQATEIVKLIATDPLGKLDYSIYYR